MKSKKTSIFKKNSHCRYCKSTNLSKFLSLGHQPPSNSFIPFDKIQSEKKYPLDVYLCQSCFLVQLVDVVPAETIFDDYLYLSSSSKALKAHYANLAVSLSARFNLKKDDVVVDIGCNDGILLSGYTQTGIVPIGVEPSRVAEIARKAGFVVFKDFFDADCAVKIVKKYGCAKIVTATNVFAHVDDIASFVNGISTLIGDSGIFVIEAPYIIDLIEKSLFDTIYHEHLCYLSLTPMVPFLSNYNLDVFDIERIPFGASGPAIRVYIKTKQNKLPIEHSVAQILHYENEWGIGSLSRYQGYAKSIEDIKMKAWIIIDQIRKSKSSLGGYSAPAKGNTLLNYFGLTADVISAIAETNRDKQGLVTPGTHIPVISEQEFLRMKPDYALLLSWNYLEFFLKHSEYIKQGGRFLVPLPLPFIAP